MDTTTRHVVVNGAGQELNPGDGVLPVLKDIGCKRLRVIGTAFYLTRYGLAVTARHVVEELINDDDKIGVALLPHLGAGDQAHFRRILKAHWLNEADIAIVQADNYSKQFPNAPLANKRVCLTLDLPDERERVITYAYPENKDLDFNAPNTRREIRGDFFDGKYLRLVDPPENPRMRFPYFESTLEVRGGASGGPVFDCKGRVIGINCSSWDFRGAEHESAPLSSHVPISLLLGATVDLDMLPPNSWEAAQIDPGVNRSQVTVRQLAEWGHIDLKV